MPGFSITTARQVCSFGRRVVPLALGLTVAWLASGCATTPSHNLARFGPYPEESETVIARALGNPVVSPAGITRTVTSVSEPVAQVRNGTAGWLVWAKIRENRPTPAGGIEVRDREYYFLLQGDKVLLSDYPLPH